MSIIILFGPEASGKMTIGQEIVNKTSYHLFHNHMIIDMIGTVFNSVNIGKTWNLSFEYWDLISTLWNDVLLFSIKEKKDLIFTFTWDFNQSFIKDYFKNLEEICKKENSNICFIELYSELEVRLNRNKTENRLKHKICKRNILDSDAALIERTKNGRLNSYPDELDFFNYIKIDNTNLSINDVSDIIAKFLNEKEEDIK